MNLVCHCGMVINNFKIWILKDNQDFEGRKLIAGLCPTHHIMVVSLYEKRITDGEVFKNENLTGNSAVKLLNRERKNLLHQYNRVKSQDLRGWIYGINKECKNNKGEIIKVKQFASDFKGNKNLLKIIKIDK